VVVDWFKRSAKKNGGRGYQTQINAVLRAFVDSKKAKSGKVRKAG
jgi:uncharacterized protein (DUF4415 family)